MNPTTYRCDNCHALWDIQFAEVASPTPVYSQEDTRRE